MKKRSYRAQKVNEIRWDEVADRVKEQSVAFEIIGSEAPPVCRQRLDG